MYSYYDRKVAVANLSLLWRIPARSLCRCMCHFVAEITPVPVPPPSGNTGIQGEIKLSVQYKHDALHVMVMHVKDLVSQ